MLCQFKKITSPFVWNGTCLGAFNNENIISSLICDGFEYWTIQLYGHYTVAMIRKTKNYTQCLVDELKPVFGLNKLGTHYAMYKGGYVILIKARTDISGNSIVTDYLLSYTSSTGSMINKSLTDKIKDIYVFRDLLCLTKSFDSGIALRRSDKDPDVIYPVSLIDSSIKIERLSNITVSTYMPEVVFNRWIKNERPRIILTKMCKVFNKEKISTRLFRLKSEIDKIIKQVCVYEYSNLSDVIIARINNKLQFE